jgi:glycosyltransferase involved in cell wall biosynthesis
MYRGNTISVVIPCYNEEEGLARVIPSLPKLVDEIIVVDNNSTDGTGEVARRLGARVVFESRMGYGAAYKAGLAAVNGEITVTMDGDGSYPADRIEACVAHLLDRNLDFVNACRFPLEDGAAMSVSNRVGNVILTFATAVLFRRRITDSQSGMWIFRSSLYPELAPKSDGMSFSEEIKVKAIMHPRIAFAEYHIPYRPRIGEVKLQKWRDGMRNLWCLVRLRYMR